MAVQTILGASGQIGVELARELRRSHTDRIRLVSRQPRRVHDDDEVAAADLLDPEQTRRAVEGSSVVYFTAGLPADTELWEAQFPRMVDNALGAARDVGARFAFFDNTYMYPQDGRVQTEDTVFAPVGRKGRVRAAMARAVLAEIDRGEIPVLIARAPEFYGPGRTQGFTNTLVLDRLRRGGRALVPVRDDRARTLIWTPDASRALALLGNTADAYGRTWHLPADSDRPTYRDLVAMAAAEFGVRPRHTVIPRWLLSAAGYVNGQAREIRELLPRYAHDNLFDSTRFADRFPEFAVTSYVDGLRLIAQESRTA